MGTGHRSYPAAPRQDLVDERHGITIPDPYRWLEDQADPATQAWSDAQDRLFRRAREDWAVRPWHQLLAGLTSVGTASVPVFRGERSFYFRQAAGAEHPVLTVSRAGTERPLLDPHALDPSGRTTLETWQPSVEGDLVACQLGVGGTGDSPLRVLDTESGATVDGPIDRVRRSSVAWLPGGLAFYYVRRLPPGHDPGEERYHRRVCFHEVGTDPDTDPVVFGDGRDKTQFYTVSLTPDGRWLSVTATAGTDPATDLWVADLSEGDPAVPALRSVWQPERARTALHVVNGTGPDDPVWLRTASGAPRGRVVVTSPAALARPSWHEVVPEQPDAVLTGFSALTSPLLGRPLGLATWTRHAIAEVTVHDLADGQQIGTVGLPGSGWVSALSVPPGSRHEAWFLYTDHATPPIVLRYDGRTGQTVPGQAAQGETSAQEVKSTQFVCTSRDGTQVRVFVVSPSGRPDQPRPAILTGYGGFGVSMSPSYTPHALAWAHAGGVFAIACLRGGGEEGEDWHRAGQGPRKQNVFDDFDAVTDALVAEGWTTPGQLGILGGSNGGLLVGAALTQHPEKYAAVACLAPLLDMTRYELSGLGPSWRPEYGTADEPDDLRTLFAYSPYHHVQQGVAYPPVLFSVFDGDTRADPLHARKMCAALQYATRGDGPVLYRLERGVGHGARAVSSEVALYADCLSFLGLHLGQPPPGGGA